MKKHSRLLVLLLIEVGVGVLSSLGLVMVFYKVLTEILEVDTVYYDRYIANFIYAWRTPWLTDLMIFITNFGAQYLFAVSLLVIIFLVGKNHQREALTFAVILLMGVGLNVFLKGMIQRPRPMMSPLVVTTDSSFPSGHAMNSTVFYLAISFYFYHFTRRKKLSLLVTAGAMILIILIGFSRVYLGVHYVSDVVAGEIIGVWWLITAILISKSFDLMKVFKAEKKKNSY